MREEFAFIGRSGLETISWTAEILQNFVPPLSVSKTVMAKIRS